MYFIHKHTARFVIGAALGICFSLNAYADLIPTVDSAFYYRMGGGRGIPVPAYDGVTTIPLYVEGDVGLNYNCSVFDPTLSIVNSLNSIKNSFQAMQQSIVNNATAALIEFPMYLLARADPSLYNLLNNAMLGARRDLEISMKSCQTMKSEIARGENPYANWATISMGDDWKYQMSLTGNNKRLRHTASGNDDINLVNQKIQQDDGVNGVSWVQGVDVGRGSVYAGGRGQPAIYILHDTSVAGYNVILQSGRTYSDTSPPAHTNANAHLVDTWANPSLAASWITKVLGEERITTFSGGAKQSTPGIGLLPDNQKIANGINQKLQNLVSGKEMITLENLKAVSAPGVMINSAVITAIREHPSITQTILIDKLAIEVATSQVIDKALLARQILQEGSQVPAIYGNHAAQAMLDRALSRLNQEMENLLFNVKVRKTLVSDTVTQLLSQTQGQQLDRTLIQPSTPPAAIMDHGAIQKAKEST